MLVIDVMEDLKTATRWANKWPFEFPVLHDADGKLTEQFAPEGLVPDLPRNQVPIASNLIIDREGRIRFYSLLDSTHFDARLVDLRKKLEELLASEREEPGQDEGAEAHPGHPATLPSRSSRSSRQERTCKSVGFRQRSPKCHRIPVPIENESHET